MAIVTSSNYPSYTSAASIKESWLKTIAPNYFDFDDTNNYNIGVFGYINEVMSHVVEDAFNAVSITRREFYPVTAQFNSSLYTMATLQNIDIPLTKPASCRCILFIPKSDIDGNSTEDTSTGIKTCVIDDTLKIFAGDLSFMIDYPIHIITRKDSINWTPIVHYSINTKNTLSDLIPDRYISSKVIKENGQTYLALFLNTIRQVSMEKKTYIVVKDTILDTVTIDVDFNGNLANFEVFYKDTANSEEVQLEKYMINAPINTDSKYVQYEHINPNKIRLVFTYNKAWTPKFNSEIVVKIYTSEGSKGNFRQYTDDIICSSDSDKYPYNANMTIIGRISGSATGGIDQDLTDAFRNKVVKAYSTNNVITTDRDLSLKFSEISDFIKGSHTLFKKKRDDAFLRLFGAYTYLTDKDDVITPSNTLELRFQKNDIAPPVFPPPEFFTIPAGTNFRYEIEEDDPDAERSYTIAPGFTDSTHSEQTLQRITDIMRKLVYNGDPHFEFTNPAMIKYNTRTNTVGYYLNSVDKILPVEYTYINDNSAEQFIIGSIEVYRNAMLGNNFYTVRVKVVPSASGDIGEFIDILPKPEVRTAPTNGVISKADFFIPKGIWRSDEIPYGYVRYFYDVTNLPNPETIQGSNVGPIFAVNPETGIMGDIPDSFNGFKPLFKIGQPFKTGDVIFQKRVKDKGKLILVADIGNIMHNNEKYVPMSIQDYEEETGSLIFEGYFSTTDNLSGNNVDLKFGVLSKNMSTGYTFPCTRSNISMTIDALYFKTTDASNEKYSGYKFLEHGTLTNTYITSEIEPFDLITDLKFTRSTVTLVPTNAQNPLANNEYRVSLDETPVIGSLWACDQDNADGFIDNYYKLNENLNAAYTSLDNGFGIDAKFYNTYGKAKLYTIGIRSGEDMVPLDNVRCSIRFGIKLVSAISNTEELVNNFKRYVRDYIEAKRDSVDSQDIYIMSLIGELKSYFTEIQYIEYYGINGYDTRAQKIIGPDLDVYQQGFIPEFLNINMIKDAYGNMHPDVSVEIL